MLKGWHSVEEYIEAGWRKESIERYIELRDSINTDPPDRTRDGLALEEIKSNKWFRLDGHSSFAIFLEEEHGWSRAYGYKLIERANGRSSKRRAVGGRKLLAVYLRDEGFCHLCGTKVAPEDATVDHRQALSKGGSDELWNLELAHYDCNSLKGDREVYSGEVVRTTREWTYEKGDDGA